MSELNDMLGMNEYPCGATNPDECTCYLIAVVVGHYGEN
ncbi:hypothetical protein HOT81_gp135 [Gordonia phage Fryberger]|uniref:Uncharacterized protein n=1 Tax=Gordonia phage Fryberger TaxID=2250392 RepID=A0A346FCT4_9CAUD|nr:hypothetical protein HOT81_gp135 [Gordonia phage Fryberger]AXN53548.1 hypothetical protein SEA_FRYBERGER_135 [Gordonia phage Fryberger]